MISKTFPKIHHTKTNKIQPGNSLNTKSSLKAFFNQPKSNSTDPVSPKFSLPSPNSTLGKTQMIKIVNTGLMFQLQTKPSQSSHLPLPSNHSNPEIINPHQRCHLQKITHPIFYQLQ